METETQTCDSETKHEKVKCVEILKWLKNEISMMRNHQEIEIFQLSQELYSLKQCVSQLENVCERCKNFWKF